MPPLCTYPLVHPQAMIADLARQPSTEQEQPPPPQQQQQQQAAASTSGPHTAALLSSDTLHLPRPFGTLNLVNNKAISVAGDRPPRALLASTDYRSFISQGQSHIRAATIATGPASATATTLDLEPFIASVHAGMLLPLVSLPPALAGSSARPLLSPRALQQTMLSDGSDSSSAFATLSGVPNPPAAVQAAGAPALPPPPSSPVLLPANAPAALPLQALHAAPTAGRLGEITPATHAGAAAAGAAAAAARRSLDDSGEAEQGGDTLMPLFRRDMLPGFSLMRTSDRTLASIMPSGSLHASCSDTSWVPTDRDRAGGTWLFPGSSTAGHRSGTGTATASHATHATLNTMGGMYMERQVLQVSGRRFGMSQWLEACRTGCLRSLLLQVSGMACSVHLTSITDRTF